MRAAPVLLAVALGLASCGGSDSAAAPPSAALVLRDASGSTIGWVTEGDTSGGDPALLARSELNSLGLLDQAGATVELTIDSERQRQLADAVATVPDTDGRFAVSAVAINGTSRAIVAVADTAPSGLADIERPTGSVMKFVIATAAVDAGVRGEDVVDVTARCTLDTPTGPVTFEGDPTLGVAPVREALARSINCAGAKLWAIAGSERVTTVAQHLGLGTPPPTPALATGAWTATPLRMAGAMAVVLGDGSYAAPWIVARVVSADGEVLYEHDPSSAPAIDATTAATTADLLTSVVDHGTAQGARLADGRVAAGKTGTQDRNTDAWMVGGTPQLTVAVWMGNPLNPGDPMESVPEYAPLQDVDGGTLPATVWKTFLDAALHGSPQLGWPSPPTADDARRLLVPGVECSTDATDEGALSVAPADATISDC